jgi:hypothetical protein
MADRPYGRNATSLSCTVKRLRRAKSSFFAAVRESETWPVAILIGAGRISATSSSAIVRPLVSMSTQTLRHDARSGLIFGVYCVELWPCYRIL